MEEKRGLSSSWYACGHTSFNHEHFCYILVKDLMPPFLFSTYLLLAGVSKQLRRHVFLKVDSKVRHARLRHYRQIGVQVPTPPTTPIPVNVLRKEKMLFVAVFS